MEKKTQHKFVHLIMMDTKAVLLSTLVIVYMNIISPPA